MRTTGNLVDVDEAREQESAVLHVFLNNRRSQGTGWQWKTYTVKMFTVNILLPSFLCLLQCLVPILYRLSLLKGNSK